MADMQPRRDWRAAATAPPGADSRSKFPVFLASVVAAAMIGAVVGLAYWLFAGDEGPARFITMPLCEYDPPWPPVPFAEADADRLLAHFPSGEKAFANQEEELFTRKLKSLEDHKGRPLVIHITGLAVVRGGKVFLLSSRARPGEPDRNWHPLEDLLDAVARCPAKEKLLILDLAHPVAAAECGVLIDQASTVLNARIREYLETNPELGAVFLSCGPGEFSQPLEEAGATAFAFYLDEALKGAADGFPNSTRDSWVKVREAAAFVTDRVSRWAYHARGAMQKPVLLGQSDFRLTGHEHPFEPETVEIKPLAYPKWIGEGWAVRDQWAGQSAWSLAPNLMRRLEAELLRVEARHRAGAVDAKLQASWNDTRDELARQWDRFKAVMPPPKLSVVGIKPPAALEVALERWLAGGDPKKKLTDFLGELKPKPEETMAALWRKINDTPLKREVVAMLAGEAMPPGTRPEDVKFAEQMYFDKLKTLSSQRVFTTGERNWPADAIHAAVRTEQSWLETMDALRPEGFGWFMKRLEELSHRKNDIEPVLWTLGDDTLASAATATAKVFDTYTQLTKELEIARDDARRAALAADTLTVGIAEFPGFALWLTRLDPTQRGDAKEQWRAGVEAATILADALAAAAPGQFPGEMLVSQSAKVTTALNALRNQLAVQIKREPDGKSAPPMLAVPRLNAKERETYWAAWRKWTAGKHQWVRENELQMMGESISTGHPPSEGDRPSVRARVAIDLGRFSGQSVAPWADEWVRLSESLDLAGWEGFGTRLLPLFAPPGDTVNAVTVRTGGVFGTSAAPARAAAQQRNEFWRWLADRYEGEARARGAARAPYYLDAVQKARSAAEVASRAAGS